MPDVDVMAFGPHPDDIELGCGGTLIKLIEAGNSVALVDMTQGEMSTRGTVETRKAESVKAAQIIGAVVRENLSLEDGNIHTDAESKRRVAQVIRQYRPRLVFIPYYRDRHPDHFHAGELLYDGIFCAGLSRYETGQESYRPSRVIYYMRWYEFKPTFIVDITAQFDLKMEAVYAYATQFTSQDASFEQTRLTSPQHDWEIIHRMAYYGSRIGKKYGEGFLIRGEMEVENPLEVRFSSF